MYWHLLAVWILAWIRHFFSAPVYTSLLKATLQTIFWLAPWTCLWDTWNLSSGQFLTFTEQCRHGGKISNLGLHHYNWQTQHHCKWSSILKSRNKGSSTLRVWLQSQAFVCEGTQNLFYLPNGRFFVVVSGKLFITVICITSRPITMVGPVSPLKIKITSWVKLAS